NYYAKFKTGLTFAFICLFSLVFLSSCKKDDTDGGARFALKDNPTSLAVPSEGVSQTYTVESDGPWKVEPLRKENWIKIEPMEGVGAGTFTVTVNRNTMLEARESVLTFVAGGKIQNTVLKIEQEARSVSEEDDEPYLNFDWMESLNVP